MSRDLRLYLDDMLEAVRRIEQYTAGLTREAFLADQRTVDFGIDEDILWDVVTNKVPALKPLLERVLGETRGG